MNHVLYCILSFFGTFVGTFCAHLFIYLSEDSKRGLVARAFFGALFWLSVIFAALSLVVFLWALCQIGS